MLNSLKGKKEFTNMVRNRMYMNSKESVQE